MNQTIIKMKMDMELKGFSPKTVAVYLKSVNTTAVFFGVPPEMLLSGHVRTFLHHAITVRKLSHSYVNSVYSSLLSVQQIHALFSHVDNIKHKTMLITAYSAGLRVGELLALKPADIDSEAMSIRVRSGKGLKERYTLLSEYNLRALRRYYKIYRPTLFLFENPRTHQPLTTRTIQSVFKRAKDELGFAHDATLHSLRHSFATHLIQSGIDISTVQKLLGHADIRTTSVYLHISTPDAISITSPLDALEVFHG